MQCKFFSERTLPGGVFYSLFSGAALAVTIVNISCNKDNRAQPNLSPNTATEQEFSTSGVLQSSVSGAIPNDGIDDTKAIQDAIDRAAANGGGTVSLSDGDYNINVDTSIYLRSNVTLSMSGNANLIAYPTSNERYAVIKAVNIHDARVLGGRIIGDRDNHTGTGGEHGYGINIKGSD